MPTRPLVLRTDNTHLSMFSGSHLCFFTHLHLFLSSNRIKGNFIFSFKKITYFSLFFILMWPCRYILGMGELMHNFTSLKWKPIQSFTLLNVVMLPFTVLDTWTLFISMLIWNLFAALELIGCSSATGWADSLFCSCSWKPSQKTNRKDK